MTDISIHASREGSDPKQASHAESTSRISIHASREGSDIPLRIHGICDQGFQSTLPAREAT